MQHDNSYIDAMNIYLKAKYSLTIADAGYSNEEWLESFGDLPVGQAVETFAEKYDLICIDEFRIIS